jgi:2-dehydropantoate 2-reductase
MKIAIFGSGGLGAYYGARFIESGHEVSFIARGAHLEALRNNGLTVYSPLGDLQLPVTATSEPADLGTQDLVIVAVKTWQLEAAAHQMMPLVAEQTVVLPFLNGVEAPDVLANILGKNKVLGGLSRIFSQIEAPGVIRHFNDSAYVEFGELDATVASSRCQLLQDAFQSAGVETVISDDIRLNLWRKLTLVSAWGGLGALSQCTMGELRKHAETRELITLCAGEALSVAQAEGHRFPEDLIDTMWAFYDALPDHASTSLSRDIHDKRPSELEAWHGVIVKLAVQHGIDVPNQKLVYHALLPMERAASQPR